MRLFILRHGIAEEHGAGKSDELRRLTSKGKNELKLSFKGLKKLVESFNMVLTSPLIRAKETAEILCEEFNCSKVLKEFDLLAEYGVELKILKMLSEKNNIENICLVGHQPMIGELIMFLISGKATDSIPLKKGGVACLDLFLPAKAGEVQLKWLLTPKQMQLIS